MKLARKVNQISVRPACPARLAAARLRRAWEGPILAAPPVRAIQTYRRQQLSGESIRLEKNLLERQADKRYMKRNQTDLFCKRP